MLKAIVYSVLLLAFSTPCLADEPSPEFFQGKFASASSMGNMLVSDDASPLYSFFQEKDVDWEKVGDTQWIARLTNTDPMTRNENETAILLTREMNSGSEENRSFLVMSRVIQNGEEMSPSDVNSLAMMIYMSLQSRPLP